MHRAIDQAGIEVHIRIQLSFDEVLVRKGNALQFKSNFHVLCHARDLQHVIAQPFHDSGPRVVALVDAVAETHQFVLALAALYQFDERRNILRMVDFSEHPQDGFIRAAVQRAVQRRDASCNRRIGINV